MKTLWFPAAVAMLATTAFNANAAPSATNGEPVARVPSEMVAPVKLVKRTHRTVVRKTTTRRVVRHRTTSSSATSGSDGAAPEPPRAAPRP